MAERRMRFGWLWLAFLAITFTGAALLFSPKKSDDIWGILLIATPVLVLSVLMGLYYWKSRTT
jgi:drug/metabolite transporter (DMT)-like permease